MYEIGQFVVYGSHGVCSVLGTETRMIDRKKVAYVVLSPVDQQDSRYFVPMQNAMTKLSALLTKEEIDQLISNGNLCLDTWIDDENARKQKYKELISGADRASLISMVRALHIHKKKQMDAGRKFHLCDENFLRDAKKLLDSEFSMTLGIPRDQVEQYILDRLPDISE